MANAGIPYLESGESLILTTDRVYVNTVQYDVLLTTRSLVLVDARYAQFQPQMIPLLTIQSVKAGKTANGEPVITLFIEDTDNSGKSESMVLLFSQHPGEQRKRERDDWLKTLMGLIVSVRQGTSCDSSTPVHPETGLHPTMRRPIAPEIPLPYTKVIETRPAHIELNIVPDEPESPDFFGETHELPEISFPLKETESEASRAPSATGETPGASQEVEESDSILSTPEVAITGEPAFVRDEIPETQDTPAAVPAFEGIPDTSLEVEESDSILSTPEVAITGEPAFVCEEIPETQDTPAAVPAFEGIPDTSQEVKESDSILSTPEVAITGESAFVREEIPETQDTPALVHPCEMIPVSPGADSGSQKTAAVSLLAAVKSLSSPSGTSGVMDTKLPLHPCVDEPPLDRAEVKVSPDPLVPPKEPEIVASCYTTEEKTEQILSHKSSILDEKPGVSHEGAVTPPLSPSPEPETNESPAVPGRDSIITEPVLPEAGAAEELVWQPAPETFPDTTGSPLPSAGPGTRRMAFIAVAAIILVILGIAGIIVFHPLNPTAPGVEPTPLPTATIQLTPQATSQMMSVIIPATGVWVRVSYPRDYYGWIGNSGSLRGVSGSGEQVYRIPDGEGIVQVQMYKTDNSGDTLTVEIYRDGKVISDRAVSIPKGSLELLIDAKTGNPPGITPVVTPSVNQTGSNSGRIMYF